MKIILFIGVVFNHSWLDCIGMANYQYKGREQYFNHDDFIGTCLGYPLKYPGRDNPQINEKFTNQVIGRNEQTKLCIDNGLPDYSIKYNRTKAAKGSKMKLWWEADNHFEDSKIHIYNTKGQTYGELKSLNPITSMVFSSKDNCFNIKNANTLCWGYMDIPHDFNQGIHNFVWDWKFDKAPGGQDYTTCFEIEVY